MKIQLLVISCLLLTTCGMGQNLVLNPSFEQYSSCPWSFSELNKATHWSNPNEATPDFFHSCNPSNNVDVPYSAQGHQYAHTGEGYGGIITFSPSSVIFGSNSCDYTYNLNDWTEYLQGKLAEPLKPSQKYCVSFWVSLAEVSLLTNNSLGVYFSNTMINQTDDYSLNLEPHLLNTYAQLNDTINWQKLAWTYEAKGGENYIILGDLKPDDSGISVYNCNTTEFHPYYFIDDVSVEEGGCKQCDIIVNNLKEECQGANDGAISITPYGGISPYLFQWSNGDQSKDITNLSAGSYIVTVTGNNGCIGIDTIEVPQIFAPTINPYVNTFGVDEVHIYEGDTFFVASGNNQSNQGVAYSWEAWEEQGKFLDFLNYNAGETFGLAPKYGVYEITLTARAPTGCSVMDKLRIIVQGEYNGMPNAFSPNEDGINDYFRPLGLNYTEIIDFRIYNRWGQELYDNSNTSFGWDGTFQGIAQPMDTYIFVLLYKQEGHDSKMLKGEFSLIR